MKKKSDLQKLSTNLQSIFGGKNWHILWQTYKLVEHWPAVVGKTVAERSKPAYIRKSILWIYVKDSIWMQQLQAQKTQLLEKIKVFHKDLDIEDIRWLLQPDESKVSGETNNISPPAAINPEEERYFEQIASTVNNDQCRSALCRLWQVYHGKK